MDEPTVAYIRDWLRLHMTSSAGVWAGPYNKVLWAPSVQTFVSEVLIEGFERRRGEAPARALGLAPGRALKHEDVERALGGEIGEAIASMLSAALDRAAARRELDLHNQQLEVLLIDVLEAINSRWCQVWPFCSGSTR